MAGSAPSHVARAPVGEQPGRIGYRRRSSTARFIPDGLTAPEPSVESLARIGDDTADALTVYLRRIRRTELFTPSRNTQPPAPRVPVTSRRANP